MGIHAGFLPSRQFVLVVASVAIVGALVFGARSLGKQGASTPGEYIRVVTTDVENKPPLFSEADSDGDGLKDWEEGLWGTDPKNSDSDRDGVDDLDEISIKTTTEKNTTKRNPSDSELTATDRLSRDLFAQYIYFRGAGEALGVNDIKELTSALAENAGFYADSFPTYSYNDLNVIDVNTVDSFEAYGNALSAILQKNGSGLNNELAILGRVVQGQNIAELQKLEAVSRGYINSAEELVGMATPSLIKSVHLNIANGLLQVGNEIKALAELEKDPLSAFIALEAYRDDSAALDESFLSLRAFFENQSIVFGPNESGYLLTQ